MLLYPSDPLVCVMVHSEQVGLAYGAVFGPDVGDVNEWKAIALKIVS